MKQKVHSFCHNRKWQSQQNNSYKTTGWVQAWLPNVHYIRSRPVAEVNYPATAMCLSAAWRFVLPESHWASREYPLLISWHLSVMLHYLPHPIKIIKAQFCEVRVPTVLPQETPGSNLPYSTSTILPTWAFGVLSSPAFFSSPYWYAMINKCLNIFDLFMGSSLYHLAMLGIGGVIT